MRIKLFFNNSSLVCFCLRAIKKKIWLFHWKVLNYIKTVPWLEGKVLSCQVSKVSFSIERTLSRRHKVNMFIAVNFENVCLGQIRTFIYLLLSQADVDSHCGCL